MCFPQHKDWNNVLTQQAILLQAEAFVRRYSVKKVLLEILQNSQENTCIRVSFLIKLLASWTPLVTASVQALMKYFYYIFHVAF